MNIPALTPELKKKVESILAQAAQDISFRERLQKDPEQVLTAQGLTKQQASVVSDLRRVKLEEWGVDVRKFRSFLRDNGNKIDTSRMA